VAEGVEHYTPMRAAGRYAGGGSAHTRAGGEGGPCYSPRAEVRTPLRARNHWQQHHVGSADRERYAAALQRGAAAVRRALQELRAGDKAPFTQVTDHAVAASNLLGHQAHPPAGHSRPQEEGLRSRQAAGLQDGGAQAGARAVDHTTNANGCTWRGAEILDLAGRMAEAPISAQVRPWEWRMCVVAW
jgi:hypothetical protein